LITRPNTGTGASISLILSVTLSAPLLAFNVVMRHGIPVPNEIWDMCRSKSTTRQRVSASTRTLQQASSSVFRPSTSTTVVGGRSSTDVWLIKGEAVGGKGILGRTIGMLAPTPKLSVHPSEGAPEPSTPPLPMHDFSATTLSMPTAEYVPSALGSQNIDDNEFVNVGSSWPADRTSGIPTYANERDNSDVHSLSSYAVAQATSSSTEGPRTYGIPRTPVKSKDSVVGISTAITPSFSPLCNDYHVRARSSLFSPTRPSRRPLDAQEPNLPSLEPRYNGAPNSAMTEIDGLSAGLLPLLLPGLRVGTDVHVTRDGAIPSPHRSSIAQSPPRRTDGNEYSDKRFSWYSSQERLGLSPHKPYFGLPRLVSLLQNRRSKSY
jgi:hypothetical protein